MSDDLCISIYAIEHLFCAIKKCSLQGIFYLSSCFDNRPPSRLCRLQKQGCFLGVCAHAPHTARPSHAPAVSALSPSLSLPSLSPRQMARLASQASLWQLARLCLSAEESKRFMELKNVGSDIGRGRAWLRAAINERTLENYLHCILTDESMLK